MWTEFPHADEADSRDHTPIEQTPMTTLPVIKTGELASLVRAAADEQLHNITAGRLISHGIPAYPKSDDIEKFSAWFDQMNELLSFEHPETFVMTNENGHLLLWSSSVPTYCDSL